MRVGAVGVIEPTTRQSAIGVGLHELDHLGEALRTRVEIHIGVEQQDVTRRGSVEDAIEVIRIAELFVVVDDFDVREFGLPRTNAVGGVIIDENHSKTITTVRVGKRRDERRHQVPFAAINNADFDVLRGAVHDSRIEELEVVLVMGQQATDYENNGDSQKCNNHEIHELHEKIKNCFMST